MLIMYTRFTDEIRAKQVKERNDRAAARSLKKQSTRRPVLITNIVLPAICRFLDEKNIASLMQTSKQIYTDIKAEKLHALKNIINMDERTSNIPVKKKVSLTISSTHKNRIKDFLAKNTGIQDLKLIGDFSKCLPVGYKFPETLRLKAHTITEEIPSEVFTNVKKLHILDMEHNNIENILVKTPNLTRLSLAYVTDAILLIVKTLTKLEHFSVKRNGISLYYGVEILYDIFKNCKNLKKFTFLAFRSVSNDNDIFGYFDRMKLVAPGLKKLKIGNSVTETNAIANCFPNLETLNMKASHKFGDFKNFKCLKRFTFANENIDDNITDLLYVLPDSIQELYIHGTINELKNPNAFLDGIVSFLDSHSHLLSLGLNGNAFPMSLYVRIIGHLPPSLRDFGTTIVELTDMVFLGACNIMAKRCPHLRYVYCYNGNGYRSAKYLTNDAIKKARQILETATIIADSQLSVYVKHF